MEAFNITFPYTMITNNITPFTLPTNMTTATTTTTITTPTTTATPWMDSRIWSRLPQRLLDRVLAFLPTPAFFRARAVCKRWYALLYSNSFLQLYLQVSPRRHWFIFFNHKTPTTTICTNKTNNTGHGGATSSSTMHMAYLFDPYELAWYTLSFPIIPLGFSPANSSDGLICWVLDGPGPKNIILHNPLVGSVTQLPPSLRPRLFPSVGLSISMSSIDVVLAGDDLISPYAVKNLTTETFHIDSSGFYSIWATTSSLPRLCSLESGQMIHCEGKFYCMNYSPFSVLAYDISSTTTWWKIQAPMRRFLRSPSLVESKGKLVLIAAVEKSKLNVPRSLRLWALQGCGTQWVEIERMPQQLYAQFGEVEGGRGFECVGHGEFIVIMIKGGVNKGLLFDIERKRWVWMPNFPGHNNNNNNNNNNNSSFMDFDDDNENNNVVNGDYQLHGFAYEPRLAAPATGLIEQLAIPPFQSFSG